MAGIPELLQGINKELKNQVPVAKVLGDIRRGREVGKKDGEKYIWLACEECGKERWVRVKWYKGGGSRICRHCSTVNHINPRLNARQKGEAHPSWKGGRIILNDGYVQIRIYPDNFFYPMANQQGYVREHRLIVARALNRCLLPWEVVHHKGTKYPLNSKGDRGDNRYPENLALLPTSQKHNDISRMQFFINKLNKRNAFLELENQKLCLLLGIICQNCKQPNSYILDQS